MKRRFTDWPDWQRILDRNFQVVAIEHPEFTGWLALFDIQRVRAPLVRPLAGVEYRLADDGFCWLQYVPRDGHHAINVSFDADGKIVQWYIDICADTGVDERGVPWFDDLYLDIVVLPSGEAHLLDADELEDALQEGKVTRDRYELAWHEARDVLDRIERGKFRLLDLSLGHLEEHFGR